MTQNVIAKLAIMMIILKMKLANLVTINGKFYL